MDEKTLYLWENAPKNVYICREVDAVIQQLPDGKPIIRIRAGNTAFYISTNIAEMIGSIGKGARERYEQFYKNKTIEA